ncbi:MAG: hypothetical protein AAGN35_07180 [Bacteroidota bacterium]
MAYAQLFQGILVFPDAQAFETALAVIAAGEEVEDAAYERETFRESMLSVTVLQLQMDTFQPATHYFETVGRLQVLAEHAVRGHLICVYYGGDDLQIEMVYAEVQPIPAEDQPDPGLPIAESYFPMFAGARYDYEVRAEADRSPLWWPVQASGTSAHGTFYSFSPGGDEEFSYNDHLGGDDYLTRGNRWYAAAFAWDQTTLEQLPDANFQLIADPEQAEGTVWAMYIPGNDYFNLYRHRGFGDVEIDDRFYANCFKLQYNHRFLKYGKDDYRDYDTRLTNFSDRESLLYFAKGVGLVRVESAKRTIVLQEFYRDASTAPPPPEPQPVVEPLPAAPPEEAPAPLSPASREAPEVNPPTPPDAAKKPWWKFW